MNKEILTDIEKRTDVILMDNKDYNELFKTLKSELITSYMRNDFRVSVLKKYASELLAIIELVDDVE